MPLKPFLEYVNISADFHPLPLYGDLSELTPEFAAAEPAIAAGFASFWASPDFPSFRKAVGNADAVITPGGPDRYRDIVIEFLKFPARDGPMVELKVYKSVNVSDNATLMYRMHGGGWSVGGHETDGAENVHAAAHPDIVVVSSAGANLAAVLALEAGGDNITGIIAQIHNSSVLSTLMFETFLDAHVPDAEPDYRHSPLLADSLRGLPPTLIQCAGVDILRDDAFAYAKALQAAEVGVEIYAYAGLPHCFPAILTDVSETVAFYERYNNFLRRYTEPICSA